MTNVTDASELTDGGHSEAVEPSNDGLSDDVDETVSDETAENGLSELTVAQARADCYDLLAAVFDGDTTVLERAIGDGHLATVAKAVDPDLETTALDNAAVSKTELSRTHDNLFIVPGPRYVPPFASAYRTSTTAHVDQSSDTSASYESDSVFRGEGERGALLGTPAAAMSRLYERVGYQPERGEFPDHVAAQFEFLAAVTRTISTHRSHEQPDQQLIERLETVRVETLAHLNWLSAFVDELSTREDAEPFVTVAHLGNVFVADDRDKHALN